MESRKLRKIPLFFSTVAFLSGCNYIQSKNALNDKNNEQIQTNGAAVDFAYVFEKVIRPKCLECHSSTRQKGDVNLETYAEVKKNLKEVKEDIEDGSMPKDRSALSEAQKQLILSWIDAGASETARAPSTPPPPAFPTPNDPAAPGDGNPSSPGNSPTLPPTSQIPLDFSNLRKFVIEPACLNCHAEPKNKGHVNLETYAEVMKNISDIEKDILDGSMPPKKKLTDQQKELILKWIQVGSPEFASQQPQVPPSSPGQTPGQTPIPNPPPSGHPTPPSAAEQEILARGRYLFQISSCLECHTQDRGRPLAGGKEIATPFGKFFAPNISPDSRSGIGAWSNRDFLKALREGVSPKGETYFPSFPYSNYSKMSDSDILAIRAYMMTLKPFPDSNKKHDLKFPFNQRRLLFVWRAANFQKISAPTEANFVLARGPYQQITEKSLLWNRGAYLVEGPLHCTACHTPRQSLGGFVRLQWMAGSTISGSSRAAPNLTPDPETGLGRWHSKDWQHFLKLGQTPSGTSVTGEMRRVIRGATSLLTPADQEAVITYFQSLAPVKNLKLQEIIRRQPPTERDEQEKSEDLETR